MTPRTTADAFGDAAAAMVSEHVVADVLTQLLSDCAALVTAQAVAILIVDDAAQLSLLSSTSHSADHLEMLQIQSQRGPCVETIETGEQVVASGTEEMVTRWGDVGQAIVDAGFQQVNAYPMRWRGRLLGGLNVFRREPAEVDDDAKTLSQAFADVATLAVVQSTDIPSDQISARVHEALTARAQIEQAKGVLAQLHHVDMATAYERLRLLADQRGTSLTRTAIGVVSEQHNGAG